MRRTALAALGVALAATCLLAVVAATAEEARDDGLPERVEVPAPKVGDRAHFAIDAVVTTRYWPSLPFIVRGAEAEWKAPVQAIDAWGVEHTVATLALQIPYEWADGSYSSVAYQDVAFDTTTWERVAVTNHEQFPGDDLNGDPEDSQTWFETRMLQVFDAPCGFVGGLIEGAGPDEEVRLGGRCGRPGLNGPDGDAFRMAAVEDIAGVPTVRFENVDNPFIRVWANQGLPFPMRVLDDFADLFEETKTRCCVFVWTLEAYEPGTEAYPVRDPIGEPTPFPRAPATLGIPDEAGTTHAFSLATAVARVAQDDPDIDRFLSSHPDAYIGESRSWSTEDEFGRVSWHHKMVFTDGTVARSRHVYTDPGPPAALAGLEGLPVGPAPTQPAVRIGPWENDGLPGDVTGLYPRPDQRAQELPRVADVLEAFLASSNETIRGTPAGWEVQNICRGDCDHPFTFVRVNVVQDPTSVTPVADAIQPRGQAAAALNVRDDGSVLSHAKRTNTPDRQGLLALTADRSPVERSSTRLAPAPVGIPYTPIAAVAGGLALATLAAWLLWPAKAGAGAMGLFSRIEDSKLLEHKGRAAIVQAIEAEPGVHLRELARRTGQAEGALRHHLRKLEAAGLVVAKPLGGYLCYFAPGAAAAAAGGGAAAATRSEGARKVLAALQGGATGVREIAAATGLAPSTVSHHLGRLREAGGGPVPASGEDAAADGAGRTG